MGLIKRKKQNKWQFQVKMNSRSNKFLYNSLLNKMNIKILNKKRLDLTKLFLKSLRKRLESKFQLDKK